ncbi:predicted protein [Postia placenta Mad-698-R]|nr:predicted protein [Postia placenta Mad-698-R]
MKLATTLVPLLFATACLAAATRTSPSPRAHRRDVIAARQAHVRRNLLDVCAGLDTDLTVLGIVTGHIDTCLCLSLLPDFLQADATAKAAVTLAGVDVVTAQLEALINDAGNSESCSYPPHASPVCSSDNVCGFTCTDGYTPWTPPGASRPTECVCDMPAIECNGVCGAFKNGCGSAVPVPLRRRADPPLCKGGHKACGIPKESKGRSWECTDTMSKPDSCGGCMVPSPFTPYEPAAGIDCTVIENAINPTCEQGRCVITACASGYIPSPKGDACAAVTISNRDTVETVVQDGVVAKLEPVLALAEESVIRIGVARNLDGAAGAVVDEIAAALEDISVAVGASARVNLRDVVGDGADAAGGAGGAVVNGVAHVVGAAGAVVNDIPLTAGAVAGAAGGVVEGIAQGTSVAVGASVGAAFSHELFYFGNIDG